MKTKYKSKGFTLIELMIVVAIIGVLSAIALPAYQVYLAKSQSTHAVTQAGYLRKKVYEFYSQQGNCPKNDVIEQIEKDYVIPKDTDLQSEYVSKVTTAGIATDVGGCSVTAVFSTTGVNKHLQGKSLVWTLTSIDKDIAAWDCTTDVDPTGYKFIPKQCRNP